MVACVILAVGEEKKKKEKKKKGEIQTRRLGTYKNIDIEETRFTSLVHMQGADGSSMMVEGGTVRGEGKPRSV